MDAAVAELCSRGTKDLAQIISSSEKLIELAQRINLEVLAVQTSLDSELFIRICNNLENVRMNLNECVVPFLVLSIVSRGSGDAS